MEQPFQFDPPAQALPPPFDNPGRRLLYLPNWIFDGPDAYEEGDSPDNIVLPVFPIPHPQGLWPQDDPNPTLFLHALTRAEHSTTRRAQTKTATQIQNLQNTENALQQVRVCTTFLNNLINYASHDHMVPEVIPGIPAELPPINTWNLPPANSLRLPTAPQQAQAIKSLAAWFVGHINRPLMVPHMNSEPSVQGEVLIGMIEPTNGLLKTRYAPLLPGGDQAAFPVWSRSCPALHRGHGQGKAGFPDFLLLRTGLQYDQGAVAEVKTWWSYEEEDFIDIFMPENVHNGIFEDSLTTPSKLLRQLWGQLHFFGCRLGFCTNGRSIMFYARSGLNTLVLSRRIAWVDPQVHVALAGLSFAAVDSTCLDQDALIDRYLCPEAHRQVGW